jgi:hypothetical protein
MINPTSEHILETCVNQSMSQTLYVSYLVNVPEMSTYRMMIHSIDFVLRCKKQLSVGRKHIANLLSKRCHRMEKQMTNSGSKREIIGCRDRKGKKDFPLLIDTSNLAQKANERRAYMDVNHFCE